MPEFSRRSPYQGLVPYDEQDAPFFFGREKDTRLIIANLFASPLTLLYGASGVGKSSVLRAGVVSRLRRRNDLMVLVFGTWQVNPSGTLKSAIAEAASHFGQYALPPVSASLAEILSSVSEQTHRHIMVILDQFEEYFLYYPQWDSFDNQFSYALAQRDLPFSFLISIREDSLAKLDRFEGRVPNLFENFLRLSHLDGEAATSAIIEPVRTYWRMLGIPEANGWIEPGLVDQVIDQVKTGKVFIGEVGRGQIFASTPSGVQIETPYLQLVMTRLWNEEMQAGSRVLRLDTLNRLGGAEHIMRTHLDRVMNSLSAEEQDDAVRAFQYLVTPSGTKIAHSSKDLAQYARIKEEELDRVLQKLCESDSRILRMVAPPLDQPGNQRFEIFHDVLAQAIVDWRSRFGQAQEKAEAERRLAQAQAETERRLAQQRIEAENRLARERAEAEKALALEKEQHAILALEAERRGGRVLRLGIVGLSLLLIASMVLAVYAFQQRIIAVEAKDSTARAMAASSVTQSQIEPELGILLAYESLQVQMTFEGEDALRQSLLNSFSFSTLNGHTNWIFSASYNTDGKQIVTASADNTARVWDALTGREVLVLKGHTDVVHSAHFSPDYKRVITGGGDGTARVWDAVTGESLLEIRESGNIVNSATYSPDGMRIATASSDGTVHIRDATTGILMLDLKGHTISVNTASFSPDGKLIVTASDDNTARLWDSQTGESLRVFKGHNSQVVSAAFSPDSKYIVTSSQDLTARIWNVATGAEFKRFQGHTNGVFDAAFSPDGKQIATASADQTVRIWDVANPDVFVVIRGHSGPVRSVAFSPEGNFVLTGSYDKTAKIWNKDGGREGSILRGHTGPVNSAAFVNDNKKILTVGADGTARAWDPATGEQLQTLVREISLTQAVSIGPDDRIATINSTTGAFIWNVATGNRVALVGHTGPVKAVAFSPNGKLVATASEDKTARVWDAASGIPIRVFDRHDAPVATVVFSPDDLQILTTGLNKTAFIWDATTGEVRLTLDASTFVILGASFSPDRKLLVTADDDATARIWDLRTGAQLRVLSGHTGPVYMASFSPDSNFIVTAGYDRTARIWDVKTGKIVSILRGHMGVVKSAAYSPDGKQVVTASADGTSRIYLASIQDLIALAHSRVSRGLTCNERRKYLYEDLTCPTPSAGRKWEKVYAFAPKSKRS